MNDYDSMGVVSDRLFLRSGDGRVAIIIKPELRKIESFGNIKM